MCQRRAALKEAWARDGDGAARYADADCPAPAGSESKVLAMVARARRGLPLFRPGDSRRIA